MKKITDEEKLRLSEKFSKSTPIEAYALLVERDPNGQFRLGFAVDEGSPLYGVSIRVPMSALYMLALYVTTLLSDETDKAIDECMCPVCRAERQKVMQ